MQYTIQLPADYDASLVSRRVENRRGLFDNLKGLTHKSFLFNAEDNIYAPFYIWGNGEAAKEFLLNDLFKGVIETFNRPRVRTWSVLGCRHGNKSVKPTFALREADLIPPEQSLDAMLMHEKEQQESLMLNPALYFHAIALDADRWEFIRYSLWKDEESAFVTGADCVQAYKVMHVSEP